jgi:hypothetical protein
VTIIFLTAALPTPRTDAVPRKMAGYQFLAKPIASDRLLTCLAAAAESDQAAQAA